MAEVDESQLECTVGRDGIERAAQISECGQYRYTLYRQWDDGQHITFLMFNPSTADALVDDHTIRKCMGFARRWGYGCMSVINLFAFRSTDPRAVERVFDPVGPLNDHWTARTLAFTRELVCAWGCEAHMRSERSKLRAANVLKDALKESRMLNVSCLGRTKGGTPRHPLMLSYDTPRQPMSSAAY